MTASGKFFDVFHYSELSFIRKRETKGRSTNSRFNQNDCWITM